jgi:SAM-dependent methyltransferase
MTDARSAQKTESEVAFFDHHVAHHGDYDVLHDAAYRRVIAAFARRVKPRAAERCIDLGCGTGAFTRRLRAFGLALTGMDLSPAAIAHAQRSAQGEQYVVGDITATGLPSGSFNIVTYSGVLHHFPSASERGRVFAEGFRLLAPGGRLFAFDPNQHSPSMWLYRDPRSPLFSDEGKTDNEVLLSRSQLRAELSAAGFDAIDVRGLSGISYRYVASSAARLILPLYNSYELLMHWSPFERWLGTFLITTARKR